MTGVEAMIDVVSKIQPDVIQATDDDPLDSEWVRYLAAIAMTIAATAVAIGVDSKVTIPNLSLIFVVPVIVAGVSLGLGPSLCSAILGVLAFNFFLTEPRYSLAVDDPANIWAIALLFVVGLIASGVAFTSRRRAMEAAVLKMQANVLQGYSREIMAADNLDAVASITFQALVALFRVPAVVILIEDGSVISIKRNGDIEPDQAELDAAQSALATRTVLRGGVYPHLASRFDFWPVQTTKSQAAVIGLAFDPDERPPAPDTPVTIVASLLALVLDRQHGPDRSASKSITI
jgi:K+-sensing histidine kinase KdpD